jgi:hypothetical protein
MDKKTLDGMSLIELIEMGTALLKYPEDRKHRQEVLKEIGERQKTNEGGRPKMAKEKIIKTLDTEALWALCQEYDRVKGNYLMSKYEGQAVFSYFRDIKLKQAKEGDIK